MFVLIDPTATSPVFAQIAGSITTQIATGTIATDRRPSMALTCFNRAPLRLLRVITGISGLRSPHHGRNGSEIAAEPLANPRRLA